MFSHSIFANPNAPISNTAFDGGVISPETLGNGNNYASTQGNAASGSLNPATLLTLTKSSFYTSFFVGNTSDIPEVNIRDNDPLEDKVFQYLSLTSESGAIFYEPVGRKHEAVPTSSLSPAGDFKEVNFRCAALGFAGAHKLKSGGSLGISLAYLTGDLDYGTYEGNTLKRFDSDTGNGVRMGVGVRYPTGPVMWGMALKNAPGFLWWKNHKRDILPVTIQAGNTWRMKPGYLFSLSGETRFYDEGKEKKNYLNIGQEIPLGKNLSIRAGAFGENVSKSDKRHVTGGLTFRTSSGVEISYALDAYEIVNEKVKKSYLSFLFPFGNDTHSLRKGEKIFH